MKLKFKLGHSKAKKIFLDDKIYQVDVANNKVTPAEGESGLYIIHFDSLRQETVQVAMPPGKKDTKKYLLPKLNAMDITDKDYLIFFKEAGETVNPALGTKEKNIIVQLISRSELETIQQTNKDFYRKGIIPFYFLLAGFTRHIFPDKKGVTLFYFQPEKSQVAALFCLENFPLEIITDTIDTAHSDYIMRTFNYFQGKYAELGLDGLIIIHPDESVSEQIKSILLLDLHFVTAPEQILLGFTHVPKQAFLRDQISLFAGYLAQLGLIAALSISIYITTTEAINLTRSISSYSETKKLFVSTATALKNNKKRLGKELQDLLPTLRELRPYHKLLLHLPQTSTRIYVDFAETLSQLKKFLSGKNSIQPGDIYITKQKNNTYLIVIKGKISSDLKKDMLEKATELKNFVKAGLKGKIKFLRNPPRPPVTGFEITIRHAQR